MLIYALLSDTLPFFDTHSVSPCCGHHEFCNRIFLLGNIHTCQYSLFSLSLWRNGVSTPLCPVIVLFRSHMEALQQPIQSCILLRCFSIALLHNVQLLGVGDICSSPPAKSPHNMVLFMCILLLYPSNVIKKIRNTPPLSEWQQKKYNHRKHIHHQNCPKPTVVSAATCKPAGEDDLVTASFSGKI